MTAWTCPETALRRPGSCLLLTTMNLDSWVAARTRPDTTELPTLPSPQPFSEMENSSSHTCWELESVSRWKPLCLPYLTLVCLRGDGGSGDAQARRGCSQPSAGPWCSLVSSISRHEWPGFWKYFRHSLLLVVYGIGFFLVNISVDSTANTEFPVSFAGKLK